MKPFNKYYEEWDATRAYLREQLLGSLARGTKISAQFILKMVFDAVAIYSAGIGEDAEIVLVRLYRARKYFK